MKVNKAHNDSIIKIALISLILIFILLVWIVIVVPLVYLYQGITEVISRVKELKKL